MKTTVLRLMEGSCIYYDGVEGQINKGWVELCDGKELYKLGS